MACPARSMTGAPRATRIHAEICEHGFDAARNTFRSAYGETTLDASLLLMAQVGFIEPDDPRFSARSRRSSESLLVDGFVKRYNTHETDDGLPPGEGAFLACSFWLADAYMLDRPARRRRASCSSACCRSATTSACWPRNTTRVNGRLLGNFPQAFSHVGLINTAFNLTRATRPAEQRAKVNGSNVQSPEAPKKPQRPGKGHEKMAEPGGHHVRRRAPSSRAR